MESDHCTVYRLSEAFAPNVYQKYRSMHSLSECVCYCHTSLADSTKDLTLLVHLAQARKVEHHLRYLASLHIKARAHNYPESSSRQKGMAHPSGPGSKNKPGDWPQ